MNRVALIIGVLLFIIYDVASAQKVIPYELKKQILNGETESKQGEWLFLAILEDVCYDSDKYGFTVNNGTLKKNRNQSFTTYEGESYHGYSCYRIKNDYSKLNVIDVEKGIIYVYERNFPPANITTCSLIKGKTGASNIEGHLIQYNSPIQEKRVVTKRRRCSYCDGKGSVKKYAGTQANMDNDIIYRCLECKELMHTYDKHIHQKCPYCIDGLIEETVLE